MKKIKYLLLFVVGAFLLTGCVLNINKFSVKNTTWYARDKSEMIFGDAGTFEWYLSETDHTKNYYKGTYKLYSGKNAFNHITKDLTKYDVTEEELTSVMNANNYEMDSLIVFDIHYTAYNLYGVNKTVTDNDDVSWYGVLNKDKTQMSLVNMKTASTYGFTKKSV